MATPATSGTGSPAAATSSTANSSWLTSSRSRSRRSANGRPISISCSGGRPTRGETSMRIATALLLVFGLLLVSADTSAQPPGGKGKGGRGGDKGGGGKALSADDFVAQFMAFDANKDGKLTK